ncbi:hypothetical protein [Cereibacter azotoformans]|uniref:hypothetical protein n=1 Tax=Cereibacter azotoformans TaxID=43057 RepID=UPI00117A14CF|nr:hypothetical protein [Cereibacter azotoformans]
MRRAENAGFWTGSYEILQAMATETSSSPRRINHFTVVQAGLDSIRHPAGDADVIDEIHRLPLSVQGLQDQRG